MSDGTYGYVVETWPQTLNACEMRGDAIQVIILLAMFLIAMTVVAMIITMAVERINTRQLEFDVSELSARAIAYADYLRVKTDKQSKVEPPAF